MARSASSRSESFSESDREESRVSHTKRRKIDSAFIPTFKQDLSSVDEIDDSEDSDDEISPVETSSISEENGFTEGKKTSEATTVTVRTDRKKSKVKPITKEELEVVNAARLRTGVVYLSRVPPFMKPQKVKQLLSAYGEIGRIFLAPEDAKSHAKRVRFGGNRRQMFTEGWIEFADKRKAKLVAETLNTNKIGGKKSSFYHDDIWNLKYLPKFKWDDLTAQISAENASRQTRLAVEIEQEKKQAKHYLKTAEKAKIINKMQESRAAKLAAKGDSEGADGRKDEVMETRQFFRQRDPRDSTKASKDNVDVPQDAASAAAQRKMREVMSTKIFG